MKLSVFTLAALFFSASSSLANPMPAPDTDAHAEKLAAIASSLEQREVLEKRTVTGTVNTDGLRYRKCPRTSNSQCPAIGQYPIHHTVTIICRTDHDTTTVYGWPWWDKLSNGYYVSDHYIDWTGGVPSVC